MISVCGSDEHGVPITIKARREGVTPQEIVDRYHELIKRSFERLGMSFDIYSRTSSPTHAVTASEFFRKLYDEGKFIERTSMRFYDEEAQTFLADRYITGTCPRCGNDRAYGDQCEVRLDPLARRTRGSAQRRVGRRAREARDRGTGICPWTATRSFCASGFSTDTRSGAPTYTASARAGSTAACSPGP